jgi:hypothetical protein
LTVWPFGRRRDHPAPAGAGEEEPAALEVAPASGEWARLPPIERIGQSPPGVIDRRFEGQLASWHPPVILRQLDHQVSASAPSGVVVADATTSTRVFPNPPTVSPTRASIVTFEPPVRAVPTITESPRVLDAMSLPPDRDEDEEPRPQTVPGPSNEAGVVEETAPAVSRSVEAEGATSLVDTSAPATSAVDEPSRPPIDEPAPEIVVAPLAAAAPERERRAPVAPASVAETAATAAMAPASAAEAPASAATRPPSGRRLGLGAPLSDHPIVPVQPLGGPASPVSAEAARTEPPGLTPAAVPTVSAMTPEPPGDETHPTLRRVEATDAPLAPADRAVVETAPSGMPGADIEPSMSTTAPQLEPTFVAQDILTEDRISQSTPVSEARRTVLPDAPDDSTTDLATAPLTSERIDRGMPAAAAVKRTVETTTPRATDDDPSPGPPPPLTAEAARVDPVSDVIGATDMGTDSEDTTRPLVVQTAGDLTTIVRPLGPSVDSPTDQPPGPTVDPPFVARTDTETAVPVVAMPASARPSHEAVTSFVSPPPTAPSVSTTPIHTALTVVQRSLDSRPLPTVPSMVPSPARSGREGRAGVTTDIAALPPIGIRTLQPISTASGRSPATAPAGESSAASEAQPTALVTQRAAGPAVPDPSRPVGPTPTTAPPSFPWRDAGEVAVQALIAQRQADGSVVFSLDRELDAETDQSPDSPESATLQRAAGVNGQADAGATSAAPAPAVTDAADLDELAKRLYGRLRVMLKHELRLDRERAGALIQRR